MRLLDLFCGAGGAAMGYSRAGFTEIVGIDIKPQKNYPFLFVQADAMNPPVRLDAFDAIHASPPCQAYSRHMKHRQTEGREHPKLIDDMRERLHDSGRPWIIENVSGSPLATGTTLFDEHGCELCGTMFGLRIWRHRLFETSFPVSVEMECDHSIVPLNPYNTKSRLRDGLRYGSMRAYAKEMGVHWMKDTNREMTLAIPPAYTEFIGRQLLQVMQ